MNTVFEIYRIYIRLVCLDGSELTARQTDRQERNAYKVVAYLRTRKTCRNLLISERKKKKWGEKGKKMYLPQKLL